MTTIGFAQRFHALAVERSPLCLGLDPSADLLRQWGLDDTPEGLRRFCGTVLDAAGDRLAVVKPQSAFFERHGPAGMQEMASAIATVRSQGALSLIDGKRGDVAGTMVGYAQAMLGADSGFGGDAMTLTAYLGFDALRPVFTRAAAAGCAVFVVVHSSNPEGRALQDARVGDGRTVAEMLADDIAACNAGAGVSHVGAVVGATIEPQAARLLSRLPNALVLAPGVGAQGAGMKEVGEKFEAAIGRTLPSVSRSILALGPSVDRIREGIERYREEAWLAAGRSGERLG